MARRALGERKIGHSGTLDPDATGMLLLGVGNATRLLRFVTEQPKTYETTIVFGSTTSTLDDSGEVTIFSPDRAALERAQAMIEELTQEAEIDKVYWGKVKRVTDFGAFVEIFPGTDGLIHISHLAEGRVERVTDVVNEGDEVLAKCIDIDPSGRIRLSRKEALGDALAKN